MKRYYIVLVLIIGIASWYALPLLTKEKAMEKISLSLSSSSFENGANIPEKFTCTGTDISPALSWSAQPSNSVKSYVLIVDDPDAKKVVGKTFVHWIALLPGSITSLPEGASTKTGSSLSTPELENDFGGTSYGGPCPPKGTATHTYRFTLFALDQPMQQIQKNPALPQAPFTAEQFKDALEKNIIGQARLTGTFIQK